MNLIKYRAKLFLKEISARFLPCEDDKPAGIVSSLNVDTRWRHFRQLGDRVLCLIGRNSASEIDLGHGWRIA